MIGADIAERVAADSPLRDAVDQYSLDLVARIGRQQKEIDLPSFTVCGVLGSILPLGPAVGVIV